LGLTPEERAQLLPSGADKLFNNRVGWALSFIKHAGLVEPSRRGYFRITERGKQLLNSGVQAITSKFLMQYPEFANWGATTTDEKPQQEAIDSQSSIAPVSPQEQMELGYAKLRRDLELELLAKAKACSPEFFEELVVQLLVAMGYGGSVSEAGRRIGRSGDGGVDGVIKEDRLGLDQLYVQAKRWDTATVGRPDVQAFVGALAGRRARRGVFITTSTFAKSAHEYCETIDSRIVLIDGPKLAAYMIDYGIGVTPVRRYEIKAIDNDFFDEDEASSLPLKASI
jgi:restriction system protein